MATLSTYGAPGVYVEWLDANGQQLEVGRTDIAGFIGIAERGPLHTARKIESMRQFVSTFGAHTRGGYLAYAIEGFFANGGRTCWVVRVADPKVARKARVRLSVGGKRFVLEASSPGAWGNDVQVEAVWSRDSIEALTASEGDVPLSVARDGERSPQVIQIDGIQFDSQGRLIPQIAASTIVGLREPDLPELSIEPLVAVAEYDDHTLPVIALNARVRATRLVGGTDGLASVQPQHFAGDPNRKSGDPLFGLDELAQIDGISLIAAPDVVFRPPKEFKPRTGASMRSPADLDALALFRGFDDGTVRDTQLALLSKCVERRDRMLLVDLAPVGQSDALQSVSKRPRGVTRFPGGTAGSYAAIYYPWLVVNDPLRTPGTVRAIPPSGHVAGMFARCDRLRGVHKPPANEVLEGVWDVTEQLDDAEHARLNRASINAIRAIPGRDVRVLGARTLSDEPCWRYVNVRRLFAMIEEALDEQMQWLVFEPNTPRQWREVDRVVRGLLERLYRAGMLDGATSEEAYFVHCDATTNPPDSTDDGRVICEIGLQPPYPAEFVVVRVGVTRSGIEILENGAQDA